MRSRNGTRSCWSISFQECWTTGRRRCESTCEPPRPGKCLPQPMILCACKPSRYAPASRATSSGVSPNVRPRQPLSSLPPLRPWTGAKVLLKPRRGRGASAGGAPGQAVLSVAALEVEDGREVHVEAEQAQGARGEFAEFAREFGAP